MENVYIAMLQMIQGIGAARVRRLVEYFGDAKSAWCSSRDALMASGCLNIQTCDVLIAQRGAMDADQIFESWQKSGIGLLSWRDAAYPVCLGEIYNAPALLYYRGDLSQFGRCVALVGARSASPYGIGAAKAIARDLAAAGITVVSGAARGIDTAAHLGALEAGKTIAVLGYGVDVAYPRENRALLERIAAGPGLVLSEYAPGTSPNAAHFPARNRIISGLSDGVVVIEAAVKSGSLITAELALQEGRDVFAVPGSIFSERSKGCHRLIKQGAKLVEDARDVLSEYDLRGGAGKEAGAIAALSAEEAAVYRCLTFDLPKPVDEIILETRTDASNISFILLQLVLRGIVAEQGPQCYVRMGKEDVL